MFNVSRLSSNKKNCCHCSSNQPIAGSDPEAFTLKIPVHWSVSKEIITLQKCCKNDTGCSLCLFPECYSSPLGCCRANISPAANIRGETETLWRGIALPHGHLPLCSLSHRRSAVTLVIIICSSGWRREEGENPDCHRGKGWRGRVAAINI